MHQSDLRPVPGSIHKKRRVGRGNSSGHGTYSGRGIKGQQSRSGRDLRIGFEGGQIPLIRALSRKKGFTNRFRVEYEPINVSALAGLAAGTTVTAESLRAAGIVKSARLPVKILGDGEISVALAVEVERLSAAARTKIEQAGGTATELTPRTLAEPAVVEDAPVSEAKAEPKSRSKAKAKRADAEPESDDAPESMDGEDEAGADENDES